MTDVAPWSAAIQLALNAPSVRNVQPWRFILRGDALELHMSDDAFVDALRHDPADPRDLLRGRAAIICASPCGQTGRRPVVELAERSGNVGTPRDGPAR